MALLKWRLSGCLPKTGDVMLELKAATTIVGLAAWRVAAMLAYEKGPGRGFKRLRSALAELPPRRRTARYRDRG